VGESLRIRENSLESGSGLLISTAGGDCPEDGCGLRGGDIGGDGGLCAGTSGRSVRSLTLAWLKMRTNNVRRKNRKGRGMKGGG
jgi:hypothetical protein